MTLSSFMEEISRDVGFQYGIQDTRDLAQQIEKRGPDFAHGFLSDQEWPIFLGFRVHKRRLEWLAGRIASKKAFLSGVPSDLDPASYRRLCVLNDAMRAPYFQDHPQRCLSLSHSHDYAIAVVANFRIGIDLEKVEPRHAALVKYFCCAEEQDLIHQMNRSHLLRNIKVTELWTRKEALAKFLRIGGSLNFKRLNVLQDVVQTSTNSLELVELKSTSVQGYSIAVAFHHHPSRA